MKKSEKLSNNIKWQLNGVLDKNHRPMKDADKKNFGFKMEITELSKIVKTKKEIQGYMSSMNSVKLNNMVQDLKHKLGYVNQKISAEMKMDTFLQELATASAEKKKALRLESSESLPEYPVNSETKL